MCYGCQKEYKTEYWMLKHSAKCAEYKKKHFIAQKTNFPLCDDVLNKITGYLLPSEMIGFAMCCKKEQTNERKFSSSTKYLASSRLPTKTPYEMAIDGMNNYAFENEKIGQFVPKEQTNDGYVKMMRIMKFAGQLEEPLCASTIRGILTKKKNNK
jgi:hypothetical protein